MPEFVEDDLKKLHHSLLVAKEDIPNFETKRLTDLLDFYGSKQQGAWVSREVWELTVAIQQELDRRSNVQVGWLEIIDVKSIAEVSSEILQHWYEICVRETGVKAVRPGIANQRMQYILAEYDRRDELPL